MSVSDALQESLYALDHGRYAEAIALHTAGRSPDATQLAALWRSEVLLYREQLADAEKELSRLDGSLADALNESTTLGECARRRLLIEAEIAYFRGDHERARMLAHDVAGASESTDDAQHLLRATYDIGRILRRQGEFESSLETLLIAWHMAKRAGNDFYAGVIAYNRAIDSYELGDVDRVGDYLQQALDLLERTEGLRYYGICENVLGLVKTDLGEFEDGMSAFSRAEQMAASLGVASDMVSIANNAAHALASRKMYEEAERRLARILDLRRDDGRNISEFFALCLLSVCQCALGKISESEATAAAALQLAEARGTEDDRFDASLLAARARALGGETEALEDLRRLVELADQRDVESQRLEARIFMAQALVEESPVEATTICRDVHQSFDIPVGTWLAPELERVESQLARAPIRVDDDGRLIIDTRMAWPSIKAAREAAERFIYDRAMQATSGNASAAGRLIGESRYQMHHLGRILRGEAPRPSRSKSPDAAQKKPVRRRSRILYS